MKKFIAIALIALLTVTAVFADTISSQNDEVKVKATVGDITIEDAIEDAVNDSDPDKPNVLFSLYGGLTTAADEKEVDTKIDFTEEAVNVFFRIYQNYKIKCVSAADVCELDITATALYLDGDQTDATNKSEDPTISDVEANPTTGLVVANAVSDNTIKFTLTYDGAGVDPRDVATFKATWPKAATSVANGTYIANVAMTLTTI